VVLPMVMDEEPRQQVQDVQIRIPGQEQTPFSPKVKPLPAAVQSEKNVAQEKPEAPALPPVAAKSVEIKAEKTPEKTAEKTAEKVKEKPQEKVADKTPAKPAEKSAEKPVEKPADKPADKPAANSANELQRAAAILSGKSGDTTASGNGAFVILIGAFSNQGNVKQLQTKIGELGIKVFTEPLDSPEGKKIRVRAGPFPSRDAADKAAEKMKRIGVNGVIAAKQ